MQHVGCVELLPRLKGIATYKPLEELKLKQFVELLPRLKGIATLFTSG